MSEPSSSKRREPLSPRGSAAPAQIGAYPTRSDAELAQTALTAAGIRSEIVADDAGGAYPFDLTGAARLVVGEADAEAAVAVLAPRRSERPSREARTPEAAWREATAERGGRRTPQLESRRLRTRTRRGRSLVVTVGVAVFVTLLVPGLLLVALLVVGR